MNTKTLIVLEHGLSDINKCIIIDGHNMNNEHLIMIITAKRKTREYLVSEYVFNHIKKRTDKKYYIKVPNQ